MRRGPSGPEKQFSLKLLVRVRCFHQGRKKGSEEDEEKRRGKNAGTRKGTDKGGSEIVPGGQIIKFQILVGRGNFLYRETKTDKKDRRGRSNLYSLLLSEIWAFGERNESSCGAFSEGGGTGRARGGGRRGKRSATPEVRRKKGTNNFQPNVCVGGPGESWDVKIVSI